MIHVNIKFMPTNGIEVIELKSSVNEVKNATQTVCSRIHQVE